MRLKKSTILIIAAALLFLVFLVASFAGSLARTERQLQHPELLIKDIERGRGRAAEIGDTLVVHYVGMLEDGTIFDSTYDKGRTFTLTIDRRRVISGWEIGLEGMREGGKRRLTIPPHLAYGESGVRGMVPPNATVIFEIELVEIKSIDDSALH